MSAGAEQRGKLGGIGLWVRGLAFIGLVGLGGCGGSNPQHAGVGVRSGIKYVGRAYTVAYDRVPEGARFAIVGRRYVFWGRDDLELSIHFVKPEQVEQGGSGSGGGSDVLEENEEEGCEVHPFAIFDGVLTRTGDRVRLRGDGRPFPTHMVPLPAALETRGELVYGTTTGSRMGVELLTRTADGGMKSEPVSESYSRPGPCSRWGRHRPSRVAEEEGWVTHPPLSRPE